MFNRVLNKINRLLLFIELFFKKNEKFLKFSHLGKIEIATLLLKKGANINQKDKHGVTPLMRAAEHGHEEMAKLLIKHGADVNLVDNYQTPAAGWARSRGSCC